MIRLHPLRRVSIRLTALVLAVAGLVHPDLSAPASTLLDNHLNLSGGTDWVNTAGPIRAEDLKGKVVLLDFWTFCCINCHHVLPDLAYLEKKYKDDLVVIGVHTPKFPAERDTDNLRRKVAEYRIKHPVINDANQTLWSRYGVESWPTLGVFDVDGTVVTGFPGEGHREQLDALIGKLVAKAKAAGTLDTRPFIVRPESEKPHPGPLKYPGKILADAPGNRLFISDTGNNRIVVTDLEGKKIATIGSGEEGKTDGDFATASFNRPQGMCLMGETLYVADTESHAIRAVDLKAKKVTTAAGTGEQSYGKPANAPAKTTGLSSPWDLAPLPDGKSLAIAMAGNHQIWKLDLEADTVGVMAGTSREDIIDGPAASAAFAQSSGLATDGKTLYVADSEGSCVRAIDLATLRVSTIVGGHDFPGVLFDFGDADGRGERAKFQHCLGVSFGDGKLYVADTYNNKIKTVDPASRTAKTLAGTRERGISDSPAAFNEPGGLSWAEGLLYVADTNNSLVRVVDPASGKTKTLEFSGLDAPQQRKNPPKFPRAKPVAVGEAKVAPGSEVDLAVTLAIPSGFKLNPEAPLIYLVEAPDNSDALGAAVSRTGERIDSPMTSFAIKVPLATPANAGESLTLKLSMSVFICKEGAAGYCTVNNFVWTVPVKFADGAETSVPLTNPLGK